MNLKLKYLLPLLIHLSSWGWVSLNSQTPHIAHTVYYSAIDSLIELDSGLDVFRDASGTTDIQELIRGQHSWEQNRGGVLNFKNTSDHIWLRFDLQNATSEGLFLQLGNPEIDYFTVYGVDKDQVVWSTSSGMQRSFYSRYLHSNKMCLPLGNQDLTIYVHVNTGSGFYLPLYIGSLKALSEINHKDDLFNGFVFGIMFVMLFYNFFLFLSIRDPLYIKYCIYLLCSTLLMLYLEGLAFDLFWRNNPVFNNPHVANCLTALTASSAIWFSSAFLKLESNAPRLKWVNVFLLAGLAGSIVSDFMNYRVLANQLVQIFSGITSIYLLVIGIILFLRGLREAKFYILSWGILVSGALCYVLTLNGVIPVNFITLNGFQLGSMMEGVLLSFALADRINTYRRDKHLAQKQATAAAQKNERLIRDQNIILEREVEQRTHQLQIEKQKSEDLLLNILPQEVAEELKEKGAAEARMYNHVSVLFTDFVNFTGIGVHLSPTELVNEIHHCFKMFDAITDKYGLEKIKTIGDAYLAVGGMPVLNANHAVNVTQAAVEIRDFIADRKRNGGLFEIRIGIHSGPVVAGIVGVKKFAYDIWGDTVNTAARMEQNSISGKINITSATYELIKSTFNCSYRGKLPAKNKGEIDMYFVD